MYKHASQVGLLQTHLGVDWHNDGSMSSQFAAAGLRMLLQQSIDEAQQLHHALFSTSCRAVPVLPRLHYEVASPSVCAYEAQSPVAAAMPSHHLQEAERSGLDIYTSCAPQHCQWSHASAALYALQSSGGVRLCL